MTISNFTEIANHDDQHEGGGRAKRDLSPSSREDGMATREKPRAVNWPQHVRIHYWPVHENLA